ncbi:GNAT family N-acetyltransferase [Paenibacillus gansuensis]|uniref:GNAT family N-acetyltransferase n=1 Tax=Paenibacillus gansuensis TaxID=306542 RepID=A0ABW5PGW7_9BACL
MNIRKAVLEDVNEIAKVHINSLKTSHMGILPQIFLENLTYEWSTPRFTEALRNRPKSVSLLVAENEKRQIVGFIWGGPERKSDEIYKGEIYAIYILSEYHGVGIGRKLVKALAKDLSSSNIFSMIVRVFAENNPSRRFYEAVGGRKVREGTVIVKDEVYNDVVYGWTNIKELLS